MIYLKEHPEELSIALALNQVGPQRREAALRYMREIDRKLSLAAFLLAFGPHGKPFLRDYPGIHFNLSHCARAVLCVISDAPVGCDVEAVVSPLDMDLVRHCCSPEEQAAILASERPELAFYGLWTRKEAFLKWTGEGLADHLPELLSSPEAAAARFETHVSPDASFVYTLCQGNFNE